MYWYVLRVAANKEMQVRDALAQKVEQEDALVTHVCLDRPFVLKVEGPKSEAVAFLPEEMED